MPCQDCCKILSALRQLQHAHGDAFPRDGGWLNAYVDENSFLLPTWRCSQTEGVLIYVRIEPSPISRKGIPMGTLELPGRAGHSAAVLGRGGRSADLVHFMLSGSSLPTCMPSSWVEDSSRRPPPMATQARHWPEWPEAGLELPPTCSKGSLMGMLVLPWEGTCCIDADSNQSMHACMHTMHCSMLTLVGRLAQAVDRVEALCNDA